MPPTAPSHFGSTGCRSGFYHEFLIDAGEGMRSSWMYLTDDRPS